MGERVVGAPGARAAGPRVKASAGQIGEGQAGYSTVARVVPPPLVPSLLPSPHPSARRPSRQMCRRRRRPPRAAATASGCAAGPSAPLPGHLQEGAARTQGDRRAHEAEAAAAQARQQGGRSSGHMHGSRGCCCPPGHTPPSHGFSPDSRSARARTRTSARSALTSDVSAARRSPSSISGDTSPGRPSRTSSLPPLQPRGRGC